MRRHSIVVFTVVIFTLALATVALAADPFIGTWKMNVAKSKIASQAPKSWTLKIEALDNGLKWTSDIVAADGTAAIGVWSGKYDGEDYANTLGGDYDAVAAKKINANTFDSVLKKEGKVVGSGRGVVSKNGKTLTITTKLKNAQGQDVVVFDKQ
jgi:hypothetical protein